ncbi:MAG: CCA tRNA nucleotidyltransferase [Deltaproteobacteria bacterium]|nr:CCA tRNA nucleotidyltransferase [Deltaproteobacteria bacterium]
MIADFPSRLSQQVPQTLGLGPIARRQDKPIYLVGGAVRDLLYGKEISDLDFVIPETDLDFWEKTIRERLDQGHFITLGAKKQTIRRLVGGKLIIDLAPLQGNDLNEDLKHRDFTINAMAWDLAQSTFHDPFAGLQDLWAGRINCVRRRNLTDDPLRIVRAVRFMLEFKAELTANTCLAMSDGAASLKQVARERFAPEFHHIFSHSNSISALQELDKAGALCEIIPPLEPLKGLPQNHHHHPDVFQHSLAAIAALDQLCEENPLQITPLSADNRALLKWAALFHDCGKALTRTVDPDCGAVHFHGYEGFSSHLARETLAGFALGKTSLKRLARLIENHRRPVLTDPDKPQDKSLRQLIFALEDDLELLMLLAFADLEATREQASAARREKLLRLWRQLRIIYTEERIHFIRPLLSGKDLLLLGLQPGPAIGTILRMIHKKQLAGTITDRQEALIEVRQLLRAGEKRKI